MRCTPLAAASFSVILALAACDTGSKSPTSATPEPAPAPSAAPSATGTAEGALRLGAPIEASAQKVALAEVAK
ncbi:MAG: hypothetical protein KF894_14795, partial [Labilithrix sp.]|nr:hypothetical protein [Labilithrix sp.]